MTRPSWTPPPGFLCIADVAKATGITVACIRIWQQRFDWPKSIRNPLNNYRYFSPLAVEEMTRFDQAGRPWDEIEGGYWTQRRSHGQGTASIALEGHTENVEPELVRAARDGDRGIVALYLASLGRMRPIQRTATVECVKCASGQLGGKFDDLIAQFLPTDANRTLN